MEIKSLIIYACVYISVCVYLHIFIPVPGSIYACVHICVFPAALQWKKLVPIRAILKLTHLLGYFFSTYYYAVLIYRRVIQFNPALALVSYRPYCVNTQHYTVHERH